MGIRIGALLLQFRKGYTETALVRTTPLNYSAPENFLKVLRGLIKIKGNKNTYGISELRGEIGKSVKDVKDVMKVLGSLSRDPFPLITFRTRHSEDGPEINEPLYDIATGFIIKDKYASVGLSRLGMEYLKYEKESNVDSKDEIKSKIPYILLTFTKPFTTGHTSETVPLNPKELFKLQLAMIDAKTPNIKSEVINEIFRGYDVGDDYIVTMDPRSLVTLYNFGFGSLTVVPKVKINFKDKYILFLRPPMRRSCYGFSETLIDANKKGNVFETFSFSNDVGVIGRGVKLDVTEFHTQNIDEIIKDIYNSKYVVTHQNTKFETVVYNEEKSTDFNDSSLDNNLDAVINENSIESKLIIDGEQQSQDEEQEDQLELYTNDEIDLDLLDVDLDNFENSNTDELKSINSKEIVDKLVDNAIQGKDIALDSYNSNPYDFTLRVVSVKEVLWKSIENEFNNKIKEIEKRILYLQEKLKIELLLEKVTREVVRDNIWAWNKNPKTRKKEMLSYYKPNAHKELPEGFTDWEVSIVFSNTNVVEYNILALLYDRDAVKNKWEETTNEIDRLTTKKNSPLIIMNEIRTEIEELSNLEEFNRKSEVRFKQSREGEEYYAVKTELIEEPKWDYEVLYKEKALPCTIYFNNNAFVRQYGINCYQMDKMVVTNALNITTNEKILIFERTDDGDMVHAYNVKDIVINKINSIGGMIVGVLPILDDNIEVMIYTNMSRVMIYKGLPEKVKLLENEYILGWEIVNKELFKYIDFKREYGATRILNDCEEINYFRTSNNGLERIVKLSGGFTDILANNEEEKCFHILRTKGSRFYNDKHPFNAKSPRKIHHEFIPTERTLPLFSEHLEHYAAGYYIPDLSNFDKTSSHRYGNTKNIILEEKAFSTINDEVSLDIKKSLYSSIETLADIYNPTRKILMAFTTPMYKKFNPDAISNKNLITKRIYNKKEE